GIECSVDADFNPFFLNANGSYVASKDVANDRKYTAFPKYILNFGLGYNLNRYGITIYLSNRAFLNVHTGPITVFDPTPPKLPTYFRSDMTIRWEVSKKMTLRLTIRNLLNRKNVLPSAWSVENGINDEPFNMSMGIAYKF
ncbi:MAG: TonB-dependent receptor, partial [bacterium]|nr:TonB-dependent receptor [bacterium]